VLEVKKEVNEPKRSYFETMQINSDKLLAEIMDKESVLNVGD